jgi:hypothetical protein
MIRENKQYIYTLSSPVDGVVRYIGKTATPKTRLICHLSEARSLKHKNKRTCWIKSIMSAGMEPVMEIVDETCKENIDQLEKNYIKLFKACGANLVNMTEGGDGVRLFVRTEEHRKKISDRMKVRIFSDEHRKKLSISNSWRKGRVLPPEVRDQYRIFSTRKKIVIALKDGIETEYESVRDAARKLGFQSSGISMVCRGKQKLHNGYFFRYK